MKIVDLIRTAFSGKKTHIIGGLMILLGWMNGDEKLLLEGFGLITLRSGVAKAAQANAPAETVNGRETTGDTDRTFVDKLNEPLQTPPEGSSPSPPRERKVPDHLPLFIFAAVLVLGAGGCATGPDGRTRLVSPVVTHADPDTGVETATIAPEWIEGAQTAQTAATLLPPRYRAAAAGALALGLAGLGVWTRFKNLQAQRDAVIQAVETRGSKAVKEAAAQNALEAGVAEGLHAAVKSRTP